MFMIDYYKKLGLPYGQIAVILPADYDMPIATSQPTLDGVDDSPKEYNNYIQFKRGRVQLIRNKAVTFPFVMDLVSGFDLKENGSVNKFHRRDNVCYVK